MELKLVQKPPVFHNAFKDSSGSSPPRPTPLLNPAPAIRLVPTERNAGALHFQPSQSTGDICAKNQANSPLLRLPTSVRTIIFAYVFRTHKVIELRSHDPSIRPKNKSANQHLNTAKPPKTIPSNNPSPPPPPFALLSVSRQIYTETHLLPYTLNTFHSPNLWLLSTILPRLSPDQRRAIRTLVLRWPTGQNCVWETQQHGGHGVAQTALGMLPQLEKIEVPAKGKRKSKKAEVGEALRKCAGEGVVVEFWSCWPEVS